jgi:hypothetical protein
MVTTNTNRESDSGQFETDLARIGRPEVGLNGQLPVPKVWILESALFQIVT